MRSQMTVELIRSMAADEYVVQAARVSTKGQNDAASYEGIDRFIGFLARDRHGSPFEHCLFTWYVEAPIFVFREFMRHRIASYNEESGRYKQLDPVFYVPSAERNMVQVGKPGAYEFTLGSDEQYTLARGESTRNAVAAYKSYQTMLDAGIAREVARAVLPVNIYSSMYVTMNARALMNFLSLRTQSETSMFPSFPQREIEMVAEQMERDFAAAMPLTHQAFVTGRRVAP